MSSKLTRVLGVVVSAGALAVSAAPVAHANSISGSVLGGSYSYNDGQDQLCVDTRGVSGLTVRVDLHPSAYGQAGPKYTFTVGTNQRVCRSLATAYEDTYYFVSFDALRGSSGTYFTKRFYS